MKAIFLISPSELVDTTDARKMFSTILQNSLDKMLGIDIASLSERLCHRERIMTTAGDGVARPHCYDPKLDHNIVLMTRFISPINWPTGSFDNKPVSAAFFILTKSDVMFRIKFGSRLERAIRQPTFDKHLSDADSFKKFSEAFCTQFMRDMKPSIESTEEVNTPSAHISKTICHEIKNHCFVIRSCVDEIITLTNANSNRKLNHAVKKLNQRIKSIIEIWELVNEKGNAT